MHASSSRFRQNQTGSDACSVKISEPIRCSIDVDVIPADGISLITDGCQQQVMIIAYKLTTEASIFSPLNNRVSCNIQGTKALSKHAARNFGCHHTHTHTHQNLLRDMAHFKVPHNSAVSGTRIKLVLDVYATPS